MPPNLPRRRRRRSIRKRRGALERSLERRVSKRGYGDSSEDSRSDDTATTPTTTTTTCKKKVKCYAQETCGGGPCRSVMGWNLFDTGLPEDTNRTQLEDFFAPHARVQSIHLIRGGRWNKGPPAIVEFVDQEAAQAALNRCHNAKFRKDVIVRVSWAFVQPPSLSSNLTGENKI